jgi:hypothetical protein
MWNGRKYAAMAIVGAGLAVTDVTPASACFTYGVDNWMADRGYDRRGSRVPLHTGGMSSKSGAGGPTTPLGSPVASALGRPLSGRAPPR